MFDGSQDGGPDQERIEVGPELAGAYPFPDNLQQDPESSWTSL